MEDACELGRRAIYHATFRDAVSGGTVSGELHLRFAWCLALTYDLFFHSALNLTWCYRCL